VQRGTTPFRSPGGALVKLENGASRAVAVVGLDDTSLIGRPQMSEGRIEDICAENSFIVARDSEYPEFGSPQAGTTFSPNDHRGVIVGGADPRARLTTVEMGDAVLRELSELAVLTASKSHDVVKA
jgi:hypothetical protein